MPQLRDPRIFTPSTASPARLSWISDFVIPPLGTGLDADLEEVDEEAVSRHEPEPLPRMSSGPFPEKPDESVVPFPPPGPRRFSPPAPGSVPCAARDPGPAPDRELPPTPAFLTGPRLWLVAAGLVLAMFSGGMVSPPPASPLGDP